MDILHKLYNSIAFPDDWRKAIIVPIHKKQDKLCCYSFYGTSVMCHCEKITAFTILKRVGQKTEEVL